MMRVTDLIASPWRVREWQRDDLMRVLVNDVARTRRPELIHAGVAAMLNQGDEPAQAPNVLIRARLDPRYRRFLRARMPRNGKPRRRRQVSLEPSQVLGELAPERRPSGMLATKRVGDLEHAAAMPVRPVRGMRHKSKDGFGHDPGRSSSGDH